MKVDDPDESRRSLGQSRRSWAKANNLWCKAGDLLSQSRRSWSELGSSTFIRFGSKYRLLSPLTIVWFRRDRSLSAGPILATKHRCWWRMLETVFVGDKFKVMVCHFCFKKYIKKDSQHIEPVVDYGSSSFLIDDILSEKMEQNLESWTNSLPVNIFFELSFWRLWSVSNGFDFIYPPKTSKFQKTNSLSPTTTIQLILN